MPFFLKTFVVLDSPNSWVQFVSLAASVASSFFWGGEFGFVGARGGMVSEKSFR